MTGSKQPRKHPAGAPKPARPAHSPSLLQLGAVGSSPWQLSRAAEIKAGDGLAPSQLNQGRVKGFLERTWRREAPGVFPPTSNPSAPGCGLLPLGLKQSWSGRKSPPCVGIGLPGSIPGLRCSSSTNIYRVLARAMDSGIIVLGASIILLCNCCVILHKSLNLSEP